MSHRYGERTQADTCLFITGPLEEEGRGRGAGGGGSEAELITHCRRPPTAEATFRHRKVKEPSGKKMHPGAAAVGFSGVSAAPSSLGKTREDSRHWRRVRRRVAAAA